MKAALLKLAYLSVAIGLLAPTGQLGAHPGHDEVSVVIGTVIRADKKAIELDVFDPAALQRKAVSIVLEERTKFRLGKTLVETLELTRGTRIEAVVRTEDMPDGSLQVRALEIKMNEPKKQAAAANAQNP